MQKEAFVLRRHTKIILVSFFYWALALPIGIANSTLSLDLSLIINGCGMGPLLVLVSPCFRETVVVTCKIWSLLCSLDNLLQKNVIVFFFENQISKWRSFEKKGYF